ncbi:Co-chaperone protein DjlA [Zhongshania aliphaticivorans]|uniref:Co-chaperone protein DjlA n=1 Tax=Zhongshania aliphaticivorans TaxID=1470434 RepID=A0A5S9PKL5_9GAMM|nr:co-chaperone DjlA [Zhongshania aliphaticivorans]CAA0104481.1 Co-chaperone protein DjlA [Zhongshania aliphaticivorans]CAA0104730.1 Co-chaperone protein DjlA [Zhongshania aliphaticivorans]
MAKIIGAILGFFVGGPLLALLGFVVGTFFDRGLGQAMRFNYGAERERIQNIFFDTVFRVMGHIAKADGRVCESEIAQTEAIIAQLDLTGARRQDAINRFKQGSDSGFQLEPQISDFMTVAKSQPLLRQMLLEALLTMALADGEMADAERDIVSRVAGYLGVSAHEFKRLVDMVMAQRQFHGGGSYSQSETSGSELKKAYQAIGVEASASDAEIKRAYRKLMSQHHPDKLVAKGVPEDMMKIATEKAQEIQVAYDLIKKNRGSK